MYTVIACLARERLEIFAFNVASPAIGRNCVANMRKTFNNTLRWDWICYGHHLIHNVVTGSFAALKSNVHNPIETEARERKQVLER